MVTRLLGLPVSSDPVAEHNSIILLKIDEALKRERVYLQDQFDDAAQGLAGIDPADTGKLAGWQANVNRIKGLGDGLARAQSIVITIFSGLDRDNITKSPERCDRCDDEIVDGGELDYMGKVYCCPACCAAAEE